MNLRTIKNAQTQLNQTSDECAITSEIQHTDLQ